jgi:2-oxoglutarate dehydrogenase complex dehydrogenase (E1) component-like enzyme
VLRYPARLLFLRWRPIASADMNQRVRRVSSDLIERYQSSFLSGANAQYVEELYEAWLIDPNSVAPNWQQVFAGAPDRAHSPIVERLRAQALAPLAQRLATGPSQLIQAHQRVSRARPRSRRA